MNINKRGILKKKIQLYEELKYDAEVDCELATIVKDENALEAAKARLKQFLVILRELQKMLDNLEE